MSRSGSQPFFCREPNRPVTKGGDARIENFSPPLEKCIGYSLKILDITQKFGPLSEKSSPFLVSQAGYGPGAKSRPGILLESRTEKQLNTSQLTRFVLLQNEVCYTKH